MQRKLGQDTIRDGIKRAYSKFGDVVAVSVMPAVNPTTTQTAHLDKTVVPVEYCALVSFFSASTADKVDNQEVTIQCGQEHLNVQTIACCGEQEWKIHSDALPDASKGTVDDPHIFRPKSCSANSSSLDCNHTHYILVEPPEDDESDIWGRETALRTELLEFISYGHYASPSFAKWEASGSDDDLRVLQNKIETRQNIDGHQKRQVPVICLMVGGGPYSLETIRQHIQDQDPVVIVQGSGRMSDFISRYYEQHHKTEENRSSTRHAKMQLCRKWRHSWLPPRFKDLAETKTEQEEYEVLVQDQVNAMDLIVRYPLLRFVDLMANNNRTDQDGQEVANPLLALVKTCLFDSSTVKESSLLPMAVRFGDYTMVKQRLERQKAADREYRTGDGYAMFNPDDSRELSLDARPLVFAAFHDRGDIVKELLDYGYCIKQIDHLIWLELWIAMTATSAQGSQRLNWGQLPLVTGFEYQAICHIPSGRNLQTRDGNRSSSVTFSLYDQFRTTGVERRGKDIWVTLISVRAKEKMFQRFDKCKVISAMEAKEKFEFSVQQNQSNSGQSETDRHYRDTVDQLFPIDAKEMWLLMEIDKDDNVLLRQKLSDDVTVTLDFQDAGSCWPSNFKTQAFMKSHVSQASKLYENTRQAILPWFEAGPVEEEWQRWKIRDATCASDMVLGSSLQDDPFNSGFDPLFRLYWAVATGREALAELLWSHTSHPLIAGFLCSYVCREMAVIRGKESLSLTHAWDAKVHELLTQLALDIGTDSMEPLFNEFVFVGREDEPAIIDQLTTEERRENTRRRATLALLNVDGESSQTRVDLAICTHSCVRDSYCIPLLTDT